METIKDIVSITHNDLDGLGCQLILRWQFNDIYYRTVSYSKIYDTLTELDDMLEYDRNKSKVIFSDLSLKLDEVTKLKTIVEANPHITFIFADHHLRDNVIKSLFKSMPKNFIDLHDENRCSAEILFYYYNVNNNKIRDFISIVNSYDMWLTDKPNFIDSLILNEIYESMTHQDFFSAIGYYGTLQDDITKKIEKTKEKITTFKNNIIVNENIYFNEKIVVSYIDKYKSIVQYYLNRPINVIISSNFNFSIRLSNDLKDYEKEKYRELFFDYFKAMKYDYYYAHKQVFGFNSTEATILNDIDSFVKFVEEKIN